MSYLDDVIRYMTEHRASAFVMPAGKNMVMQVGERHYTQPQTIDASQLTALILEEVIVDREFAGGRKQLKPERSI